MHVQRDIDYTGSTAPEGELKTKSSDRFVPVPDALKEMLLPVKGKKNEYVFHTSKGKPISEASFRRMWLRLMMDCGCVEWREIDADTDRPQDIRKQVKPTLMPHYFRHNYVTMLYEAGIDPLIAMKIVGHSDYQNVFRKREE